MQTQMNVRIDDELKTRGDAALARIGYGPSAAVRQLWTRAAGCEDDAALAELGAFLSGTATEDDAHAQRIAAFEHGRCSIAGMLEELGAANAGHGGPSTPDEELLEQALLEQLDMRGLS